MRQMFGVSGGINRPGDGNVLMIVHQLRIQLHSRHDSHLSSTVWGGDLLKIKNNGQSVRIKRRLSAKVEMSHESSHALIFR
jgi:hypothetical protein